MQDQKTAVCTLYPGVIPIMAYMGGGGGAPLERPGTIFRLRRIKKGRDFITWSIWRGRGIFSFVWNKGQEGLTDAFHGFEKVEKTFCFCDLFTFFLRQSIWKVKGCKVLNFLGVWKGYHLSMEGIRKGYLFCQIWLDQVSPHPPPPLPPPRQKAAASNQPVFLFRTLNICFSCFRKRNLVILKTTITWQFLGEYAISGHRCVMSRF